jgi:predicted dienelactone hydrolase
MAIGVSVSPPSDRQTLREAGSPALREEGAMRHRTSSVSWLALGAAALIVVAAAACSADDDEMSAPDTTSAPPEAVDFSVRGPFAVGVTELDGDPPVLVLYPADRDAVPEGAARFRYTAEDHWGRFAGILTDELRADFAVEIDEAWRDIPASERGPFPLVVFSHGAAMSRFGHSSHGAHLASWGYVVAIPRQSARDVEAAISAAGDTAGIVEADLGVIDRTIASLTSETGRPGSVLEDRVALGEIAVAGHSAGGAEALLAAYRSDVGTSIALVPTAPVPKEVAGDHQIVQEGWYGFDTAAGEFDLDTYLEESEPPAKPSLIVFAENDLLYPVEDARAVFDWLPSPKRFAVLARTGHFVFVDSCGRSQDSGGSEAVAAALGQDPESLEMRYIENGCSPADAPVAEVTALWNHLTVAHLRSVFDVDRASAEASLDPIYLDQRFPDALAEYRTE